jgi:hypothetical protein
LKKSEVIIAHRDTPLVAGGNQKVLLTARLAIASMVHAKKHHVNLPYLRPIIRSEFAMRMMRRGRILDWRLGDGRRARRAD